MKKGIVVSLTLLMTSSLFSCSKVSNNEIANNFTNSNIIQSSSVNSDWYGKLPENLKSYYASAEGKTGMDLFLALNKIISKNNKVSGYKHAKSYMYSDIDNNLQNKGSVMASYSQIPITGRGGNGNSYKERGDANSDGFQNDFINCEHTWPQSMFSKKLPMVADLHHLQSTLSKPNATRYHYAIGNAEGDVVSLVKSSGAKLGAVPNEQMTDSEKQIWFDKFKKVQHRWDNNSRAVRNEINSKFTFAFEPPTVNKGNTARMLMYFYLRYYNQKIRNGSYESENFWQSKIGTYITWSTSVDKVDSFEKTRNDRIFKKQGNRNPFVDIQGLGKIIGENTFLEIEKRYAK